MFGFSSIKTIRITMNYKGEPPPPKKKIPSLQNTVMLERGVFYIAQHSNRFWNGNIARKI
jgi:hypothetical protein